jgi:serine/threonine-protein kinase RsbW
MDTITIHIPASPQYVQIVRLIASGLAARLRFTIEDIEDLKIAVDELAAYLTGTQGRPGTLEIEFTIQGDRIVISGTGHFEPGQKVRADLTEFSRMILNTVADEATFEQDDGVPRFTLTKIKKS